VYPPPEVRTSRTELLGATTGIILTAIVAVVGLVVLLGSVYWADYAQTRPPKPQRQARGSRSGVQISPGQGHEP
jgi:hypothetical protein